MSDEEEGRKMKCALCEEIIRPSNIPVNEKGKQMKICRHCLYKIRGLVSSEIIIGRY